MVSTFMVSTCLMASLGSARAQILSESTDGLDLYGQFTNVTQWHDHFRSPYRGANSLDPSPNSAETTDVTLLAGIRLSEHATLYINPEIDQGFGLSNTLGIAGFPSGEAYKIGANAPYLRLPRAFVREVINLGGDVQSQAAAPNQMSGELSANNVTLTIGKFSVVDVFDTNSYAHDPRSDFFNWAAVDAGAFDYAADSWGFTYGAAAEWSQDQWTARIGLFDISTTPNGKQPDPNFSELETVIELEERHQWGEHPGKIKVLLFANHARLGRYSDAVALGVATGTTPSTSAVLRMQTMTGAALNVEQEITSELGWFGRASANDGKTGAYDFTDINRSLSTGIALHGDAWGRHDDTVGVAAMANGLSSDARTYFEQGGLGVLVGDGRMNYATEKILESYYAAHLSNVLTATLDYQFVDHPAYNRDRGPVSIVGVRLHADF